MCKWILSFLTERTQVVRCSGRLSGSLTLNTGAPQGCCLSPFLFTLFTNDCVSTHDSVLVVKFSDDTTVSGLITDADESAYRNEVGRLVDWCDANNLVLNVSKTKELVADFRSKKTPIQPLVINDQEVEIVESFRFLGSIISCSLKWEDNVTAIRKKAQQRLYFLRQLLEKVSGQSKSSPSVLSFHNRKRAHFFYHHLVWKHLYTIETDKNWQWTRPTFFRG
jgi:hypothetical protein